MIEFAKFGQVQCLNLRSCNSLIRVKCVHFKPIINEELQSCRDALGCIHLSLDVRKHVCLVQTPTHERSSAKRCIPTNSESYNCYHDNRNKMLSFTIRPGPSILC